MSQTRPGVILQHEDFTTIIVGSAECDNYKNLQLVQIIQINTLKYVYHHYYRLLINSTNGKSKIMMKFFFAIHFQMLSVFEKNFITCCCVPKENSSVFEDLLGYFYFKRNFFLYKKLA